MSKIERNLHHSLRVWTSARKATNWQNGHLKRKFLWNMKWKLEGRTKALFNSTRMICCEVFPFVFSSQSISFFNWRIQGCEKEWLIESNCISRCNCNNWTSRPPSFHRKFARWGKILNTAFRPQSAHPSSPSLLGTTGFSYRCHQPYHMVEPFFWGTAVKRKDD